MGCIKTGGEEESKDTTDSLDMLIFGFRHLTQVKDMENILTSQLLPFFYKTEAAAYWNCKSIMLSSSNDLFRDWKCWFDGLNLSIVKSLNAKLCEWKQAISPQHATHTKLYHAWASWIVFLYWIRGTTGQNTFIHFLLQPWIFTNRHIPLQIQIDILYHSLYNLTPLLWMCLRWSGLNSSQMLTMRWWWAGIQGWLHPPWAAAIHCDKFKTHAAVALSAKPLLQVERAGNTFG